MPRAGERVPGAPLDPSMITDVSGRFAGLQQYNCTSNIQMLSVADPGILRRAANRKAGTAYYFA